jgi:hypothetical protein
VTREELAELGAVSTQLAAVPLAHNAPVDEADLERPFFVALARSPAMLSSNPLLTTS